MSRWFRVYDDVINDPKLLKLPETLRWQWLAMLCVASKNGGKLPSNEDIALMLRVPEAKAAELVTKLVKAKLIDNVDGAFVPHNWEGRQFKSDTSNDRVRKHRDGKRNVTPKQEFNVTSSLHVTAPEAEAEAKADTETEQSRADAGAPVDEEFGKKLQALTVSVGLAFSTRAMPAPALNRCSQWLRQGYAQGTILGAIERVLKRGKEISTLDYFDAAIAEDHAKAPVATGPQIVSIQEFIVEGTPEWSAWNQHLRETTGRGSPVTDNRDEHGRIRRGWFRPTTVPPGYDEATGEKLPSSAEDAA